MHLETKNFYRVVYGRDALTFDTSVGVAHPILWNNRGTYCIISRGKVQNMIDSVKDNKLLPQLEKRRYGIFHWDDGVVVDAKTVVTLLLS